MGLKTISDIEVISKCARCQSMLRQDSEAFGLGVKFKPEANLSAYEGKSVLLTIISEDKNIPMMVTANGTDTKNDGCDGMFLLCSEKCGIKMKATLEREIRIGSLFHSIVPA